MADQHRPDLDAWIADLVERANREIAEMTLEEIEEMLVVLKRFRAQAMAVVGERDVKEVTCDSK
jgi:hypothetical protein